MATMDARRVFIDTNILVYANIQTAPLHIQARTRLQDLWNAGEDLWISRQILREYGATITRPQSFMQPMVASKVVARIQYFEKTFEVANDDSAVTQALLELLNTVSVSGKQIHDANIVATMQAYHITHLLTHNTSDFTRYTSFIQLITL